MISASGKEMSLEEIAYIAGFFDGEGCICLARNGYQRYALQVTVSQQDPRPLEYIVDRFGGKITLIDQKGRKNLIYRWVMPKMSNFLELITPLLLVKREQAELALKYKEMRGHKSHPAREEMRAKIAWLKQEFKPKRAYATNIVSWN